VKSTRAAVLYGPNDVRVENINIADLRSGWILLKVRAAGICGSDLHFYKEKVSIPVVSELGEGRYVPGHELSGEVYQIGPDVKGIDKGDRVGVEPTINCGVCEWCHTGWYNLCSNSRLIGFYLNGGMAEYCAVPADKCFKLPENVSFEEAAILDCISVAEHAVKLAQVSNEDTVAVFGAGTIGLLAVKAALLAGAREVHAIGTHDFQLKVAKDFGATSTINARTQKPVDRINELTGGNGVDKVIEAVGGASSAVSDGLSMLRRRGTLVTTGIFTKPITIEPFGFLTKELVMRSAWGYEHWTHVKEFALSLDLLARGKVDAKRLVTHRYPLNEAPAAFDAALNKEKSKSIKVQIVLPK